MVVFCPDSHAFLRSGLIDFHWIWDGFSGCIYLLAGLKSVQKQKQKHKGHQCHYYGDDGDHHGGRSARLTLRATSVGFRTPVIGLRPGWLVASSMVSVPSF